MRKLSQIVSLLGLVASCSALADIVLKNGGTTVGPVTSLNCSADAGVLCTRTTGSVGNLRCNAATAIEPGCVVPSAQTLGGDKTWNGSQRIVGVVHGSLEACDGSHVGLKQTCSTHNAEVFCNGSVNIEYTGPASTEKDFASVYVNGVPQTLMGNSFTCQSACVVTAIEGTWVAGATSDGGTLVFRLTDGTNNCDCTQACDNPSARCIPTGTCSFAAGVTVTPRRASTTCTMNPYVGGNLQVKGTTP